MAVSSPLFSYKSASSEDFQLMLREAFEKPLIEITSLEQFQEISKFAPKEKSLSSTRFSFFRHGTSEGKDLNLAGGGLDEHKLTQKGVEEIKKIGQDLLAAQEPQVPIYDAIFSSPAISAVQTADILANILNIPSTNEDARLSQKHWGFYHGKLIDKEYKATRVEGEKATDCLTTFWDKWNFKFDKEEHGEESLLQVFVRMMDFLLEMSQKPELKGKNVYVSTHTPLLKTLFASLVAFNEGKDLAYHRHDFGNGASVVVDISEAGEPSLVSVNGVSFRGGVKYQS